MDSCPESVPDADMDLISRLPPEIKDRILERLTTQQAARIAVLSTQWRDAWLRHARLEFCDINFCCGDLGSECTSNRKSIVAVSTISLVLLKHVGPIKKFTLNIFHLLRNDEIEWWQSYIDWWCFWLSRKGIEELVMSTCSPGDFNLPVCILSSSTIKQVTLTCVNLCFPDNAPCIFPSITSLNLVHCDVQPGANRTVYCFPNLENFAVGNCDGINHFEISSPKLHFMFAQESDNGHIGWRWFLLQLETIRTLWLRGVVLRSALCDDEEAIPMVFPTASNLQEITLYNFDFACSKQLTFALLLLQKSPKLRELQIVCEPCCGCDCIYKADVLRIFEEPNFINEDLPMLNTLKIESFSGTEPQMRFVKALLLMSPALNEVVIHVSHSIKVTEASKIAEELLLFSMASPNAELVFKEEVPYKSLSYLPKFFKIDFY